MEKQQVKGKNLLQLRAYRFGISVIDLLEILPRNYIYEVLGKQLLRAATSIGANIILLKRKPEGQKETLQTFTTLRLKARMRQNTGYRY